MITRGVIIWGSGSLLFFSTAVLLGSAYQATPTLPDSVLVGFMVACIASGLVYFSLVRNVSHYSKEIVSPYRQLGWTVEVAGFGTGKLAPHLFEISEMSGQEVKPLFRMAKAKQPGCEFVVARLQTPATFLGNQQAHHETMCTVAQSEMLRSIEGWVSVKPTKLLEQGVTKDIDLESAEFNRLFEIRGSQPKHVWLALAPDLMSWFMDLPRGVWMHVEGKQVSLLLPRSLEMQDIEKIPDYIRSFLRLVEKSGALAPIPNK